MPRPLILFLAAVMVAPPVGWTASQPAPSETVAMSGRSPLSPYSFLEQWPDHASGFFSDAGCDSCPGGAQVLAENFLFEGENLCWLNIYGGYLPGSAPPQDDFTVIFHEDLGGFPGAVVATLTGLNSQRSVTGATVLGVDEYFYEIPLDPNLWLDFGQTYWVEIYNNTASSPESFFWETGDLDPAHGLPGYAVASESPGMSWQPGDPEFELSILGFTGCSPIPTLGPRGMILLLLALFAGAGLILRRSVGEGTS